MPDAPGTAPSREETIVIPAKIDGRPIVIKKLSIGKSPDHLQKVRFQNDTGKLVRLWIPRGALLFVPPKEQHFDDLPIEAGRSITLTVKNPPAEGTYPYHVFCEDIDGYALGGSPPTMSCP